ncbi:hypothetical protein SPBR_03008 [Sporothrix brasiliensis 5110]|uniref:PLC-like phosphodiesterase n=1 Tax=Sporothrix brasiliensis 5110 TaxID=1398154 RepID=A0A0C2IUW9_9PEZI|nr:uncharacterized protein SPBR_03008 [Sporothrix brasiliensis 5110]KIH92956.1 hypothetical protein SPBR_03008 [Sporothrix brasiliensis 5110]
MACNNSPLLCGRSYSSVTHLGAHDSAFLRDSHELSAIAGDQFFNATLALSAGVRLLQAQVHFLNGTLFLCHTSCGLLNAGLLETWLGLVARWMDTNPHDVVTLLLVNSDNQAAAVFGRIFQQAGLSKYGYARSASQQGAAGWPTLQAMIAANTRLVTFIASIAADASYPYLLNEFDHVFETPYMVTNLVQFSNCSLDRPPSAGSAAAALRRGMLPLLNHFAYAKVSSTIQIPDVSDIDVTNSPDTTGTGGGSNGGDGISGTLGAQANRCTTQWGGTKPAFLLVDFFNRGPAITTADNLNGLTAATTVGRTITQEMQQGAASRSTGVALAVQKAVFWRTMALVFVVGASQAL